MQNKRILKILMIAVFSVSSVSPSFAASDVSVDLAEQVMSEDAPKDKPIDDAVAKELSDEEKEMARLTGLKKDLDLGRGTELTLEDCVRIALERSPRIKSAGYEVEAADGQLSEAAALFWPVMEYESRLAPVPTDVDNAFRDFFNWQVTLYSAIHVQVGFPLLTFGQLGTAERIAKGGVEAARINQEKARENVVHQVKQLYFGIQMAKEMVKMLDDAVGKITNKISEEEAKEEKEIDPYDLQQLKLSKIDIERRAEEAKNNLVLAEEGMRIHLDIDPGVEVDLDSDNLKPMLATLRTEEEFIENALELQPEAKLLKIGVDTKKLQYKLEKFKMFPKIAFGFYTDVGRTMDYVANIVDTGAYNDPFNYTRAGIGIIIKGTLDVHGSYSRIKKARAEYHKAIFDGIAARRALALDIRKSFLSARRAQEDVKRAKKAQAIARQMVFTSQVNVDLGIGDNQRYGDALKTYLYTRGAYFKAVFDYNLALSDLTQRVGSAKYQELVPIPDAEEYELFDTTTDDEGLETLETIDANRTTEEGIKYENQ